MCAADGLYEVIAQMFAKARMSSLMAGLDAAKLRGSIHFSASKL